MNTPTKLVASAAALTLLVAGAFAAGSALGPTPVVTAGNAVTTGAGHGDANGGPATPADLPGGLASSHGGYTLTPLGQQLRAGTTTEFAFRITGPDGAPVTAFDVVHDKPMHLILVRRDTVGFQHLHPQLSPAPDDAGTWRVPLRVAAAGTYRAFADFTPSGGQAVTLGADLFTAGRFEPVTHTLSRVARVDGYTVELTGELDPGRAAPLGLAVSKDGRPVADLQPYLGAHGHLVALREGDLAYLHVHPDGAPGTAGAAAGPEIRFVAEVPSAGTYRLFLDFRHDGVVRTAEFTVATRAGATQAGGIGAGHPQGHADGHPPAGSH